MKESFSALPFFGWLPRVLEASPSLSRKLAEDFLRGAPAKLPRLAPEARAALALGRSYVQADYTAVVEALPGQFKDPILGLNLRLLVARALLLKGEVEASERMLAEVEAQMQPWRHEIEGHLALVQTERELFFGRFASGKRYCESADPSHLGLFERLRLSIVQGGIAQAQGRVRQAADQLLTQKRLIAALELPDFRDGWLRRTIAYHLDSENYVRAERAILEALARPGLTPRARLLLLKEKLRLELRRGRTEALESTLQDIDDIVRSTPSLENIASFLEERCEYALQKKEQSLEHTRQTMEEQRRLADKRGDLASMSLTRSLLGRLAASQGELETALRLFDEAETIARAEGYGRVLVRVLLFRVGLLLRMRRDSLATLTLAEAEQRARECHLPVQEACCRLLRFHAEGARPALDEMIGIFNRLRSLHEFIEYLGFYGLEEKWVIVLRRAVRSARSEMIPLLRSFETVFTVRGWYLFRDVGVVLHSTGKALRAFRVDSGTLVERLTALVVLTLPDEVPFSKIHALSLQHVPYRSDRHGAKVRTLVRRTKVFLEALGANLATGSRPEALRCETRENRFALRLEPMRASRAQTEDHADRILAHLKMCPNASASTHELCKEFGLSRQRLAYTLASLRQQGIVKLTSRGRSSRWTVIDM